MHQFDVVTERINNIRCIVTRRVLSLARLAIAGPSCFATPRFSPIRLLRAKARLVSNSHCNFVPRINSLSALSVKGDMRPSRTLLNVSLELFRLARASM